MSFSGDDSLVGNKPGKNNHWVFEAGNYVNQWEVQNVLKS